MHAVPLSRTASGAAASIAVRAGSLRTGRMLREQSCPCPGGAMIRELVVGPGQMGHGHSCAHALAGTPLATAVSDCRAAAQATERAGRKLMVGQFLRHHPARNALIAASRGCVTGFERQFRHD